MKQLYRVEIELNRSGVFVVWADDSKEAEELASDAADDLEEELVWSSATEIDCPEDIPRDWNNDEPVGGDEGLTCLELMTSRRRELLIEQTVIDTRQLGLGQKVDIRPTDNVDRACAEYARLLTKIKEDDYTQEELDRCYELARDSAVQQRLEAVRQSDVL